MEEERLNLVNAKLYLEKNIESSLESDLFFYSQLGSKKCIQPHLSDYESNVLGKVKTMLTVISQVAPRTKTVFTAGEYAAFLEGTLQKYDGIHLFSCCPASEIVIYSTNLAENLPTYLGNECSSVRTVIDKINTELEPGVFPKSMIETFEVKYKDGITLTFHYLELYLQNFSLQSSWMNMFSCLCFGCFCSLNKLGLLLSNQEFILYRKQNIKQMETDFHAVKTFGSPFGLGYLCYSNLVSDS